MAITLEQFKALKPGDKVRIIKIDNGRPAHWARSGSMDKYAGRVVTFNSWWSNDYFDICEDVSWTWKYEDIDSIVIECKNYTREDMADCIRYLRPFIYTGRCNGKTAWAKEILNSLYGISAFKDKPLVQIDKVIFHDPATIVFWKDGTKTVVKAGTDEYFDKEKGLAMAISKKVLGNKGNYYNTFKKHGAIDDSGEVFVPLSLLKECTTLRKMKELIAFMEG